MANQQQSLFGDEPEPWERDAAELRSVASVVLPNGPDRVFDYEVPDVVARVEGGDGRLEPGQRVQIPFGRGNHTRTAYCVELQTRAVTGRRLKQLLSVVDAQRLISPSMLRLTRWIADHYLCSWGQVLESILPAGVREKAGTRRVQMLQCASVEASAASRDARSAQQRRVLDALSASKTPMTMAEVARQANCTEAPIRRLIREGLITSHIVRVDSPRESDSIAPREAPLELNADQSAALAALQGALDAKAPRGIVLYGVTGSGKTEVYLQAIEYVVSFGRQAIVLVPEISLTPQTVQRFRARFDHVAVLHSQLTNAERHSHWRRIARGEVQVVVGARSAVFAPTPHLGLIVIDEEHETSFKQDQSPHYHARDVAWQRALAEKIPLVLGSATPSLETWQRTETGEFLCLSLPRRVRNLPMPDVATVDMRDPANTRFGKGAISRALHQAMSSALRDDGQVILLLNRRGYATHIQCPACGFVLRCRDCDLALTFHRQGSAVLCHYCEYSTIPPTICPDCKSPSIRYGGVGTQKLEAEVRARFPEYALARMDTDAMRGRGSHDEVLDAFRRGDLRILLGTQMIAKGLDFPNVTLVGVVNADTALHLADFRAAERTFQLVAQVAGRTGRGQRGGRVLVQTLSPDHPAIQAAARHDYLRFARHEMAIRRAAYYPPIGSMARIVVRGAVEPKARETAEHLACLLRKAIEGRDELRLIGPAPAPIARLRGEHRFHLQLQAARVLPLQEPLRHATAQFRAPDKVFWSIDIDPWDMM